MVRKSLALVSLAVILALASSLAPRPAWSSTSHRLNALAALPRPPLHARQAVLPGPDTPGATLWVKRYDGRAHAQDTGKAVAISPDGTRVFVTGTSERSDNTYDFATVAYNAATGALQWVRRFSAHGYDLPTAIGASPDGSTVFVTGTTPGPTTGSDYTTIAYDAATGTPQWVERYNGQGNGGDVANALAVSPDSTTVLVTGFSCASACGTVSENDDYATVAYDAITGAQVWVERYNGPANLNDQATALAVSPSGSIVFVTGISSNFFPLGPDEHTVAYETATGAQLWVEEYQGPNLVAEAYALGVSPDGSTVFVTGDAGVSGYSADYVTVAYDAVTGAQGWVELYNGTGDGIDEAHAFGVSQDGVSVFVTGYSWGLTSFDYATVAYDAANGTQRWVKRYNGPADLDDVAVALRVSPINGQVNVTGQTLGSGGTSQYGTVAYDATTGHAQWVAHYSGPSQDSFALAVGVSPDGSAVFVTGSSFGPTSFDYATIAYSTS